MQILSLDEVDSTQRYLLELLKSQTYQAPLAVITKCQFAGKGSRGNAWLESSDNLYFSFAIEKEHLPKDLRLESASIYFTYLLKELLAQQGSKVWLKWPNDFYLGDKKIGGAITNFTKGVLVCGIGLNTKSTPDDFGQLDIEIENILTLEQYLKLFENPPQWKQVFRKYRIEFIKSKNFFTHINEEKISLKDAELLDDGSLICEGERIFGLR